MITRVTFAYNLDVKDVAFLRKHFFSVSRLTEDVPGLCDSSREFAALPTGRATILSQLKELFGTLTLNDTRRIPGGLSAESSMRRFCLTNPGMYVGLDAVGSRPRNC
jgi:hypothetical protein